MEMMGDRQATGFRESLKWVENQTVPGIAGNT